MWLLNLWRRLKLLNPSLRNKCKGRIPVRSIITLADPSPFGHVGHWKEESIEINWGDTARHDSILIYSRIKKSGDKTVYGIVMGHDDAPDLEKIIVHAGVR